MSVMRLNPDAEAFEELRAEISEHFSLERLAKEMWTRHSLQVSAATLSRRLAGDVRIDAATATAIAEIMADYSHMSAAQMLAIMCPYLEKHLRLGGQ